MEQFHPSVLEMYDKLSDAMKNAYKHRKRIIKSILLISLGGYFGNIVIKEPQVNQRVLPIYLKVHDKIFGHGSGILDKHNGEKITIPIDINQG